MNISTLINAQLDAAHIGPFHDRVHGHTWHIEARFRAWVVRDGAELEGRLKAALAPLDHGLLDDTLGRENATAEGVAAYLFEKLQPELCTRVRVWRSGAAGAEVEI